MDTAGLGELNLKKEPFGWTKLKIYGNSNKWTNLSSLDGQNGIYSILKTTHQNKRRLFVACSYDSCLCTWELSIDILKNSCGQPIGRVVPWKAFRTRPWLLKLGLPSCLESIWWTSSGHLVLILLLLMASKALTVNILSVASTTCGNGQQINTSHDTISFFWYLCIRTAQGGSRFGKKKHWANDSIAWLWGDILNLEPCWKPSQLLYFCCPSNLPAGWAVALACRSGSLAASHGHGASNCLVERAVQTAGPNSSQCQSAPWDGQQNCLCALCGPHDMIIICHFHQFSSIFINVLFSLCFGIYPWMMKHVHNMAVYRSPVE